MRCLIQRVSEASVRVNNEVVGAINAGLLVLVGIQQGDDRERAKRMSERLLDYRVFADDSGRMNLSVRDIQGGVLLVSQFTLAADTRKGLRPGFSTAAPPDEAELLFDWFVDRVRSLHPSVATGQFGADMKVSLVNDGPVTFLLET